MMNILMLTAMGRWLTKLILTKLILTKLMFTKSMLTESMLTKLILTKLMLTTMERWLTKWLLVTEWVGSNSVGCGSSWRWSSSGLS